MIRKPIHLFVLFLSFSLTFSLSSCSTGRPTGNPLGPIVGATAAGGTAALLGANKYLIGLSAIGGGALGYYFTTRPFQTRDLTAEGGQVFVQGDYVTINLPVDSTFESNSDEFLPGTTPALKNAVTILMQFPNDNIFVSGNSSGFDLNKREEKLSEKRAKAVADFLRANGITPFARDGIIYHKLTYIGYGHYFPIANDIKAKSIRQNSHIQIVGYPNRDRKKRQHAAWYRSVWKGNAW